MNQILVLALIVIAVAVAAGLVLNSLARSIRGVRFSAHGVLPRALKRQWLDQAGWVRRVESCSALPDDPAALKVRVADLERQVKRLEMEKEILKKRRPSSRARACEVLLDPAAQGSVSGVGDV